jgi:alpha-L-fucosidase
MSDPKARRLKAWEEARFGMFIHWGLYSTDGLDCWKMHDMGIPAAEYRRRFEPRFRPTRFDARAFARVAKSAGCKYVVMGSRHHEGYCLWNTKTTRFSSVHMTPKRDFIAEYVEAVRAAGLMVGFYYSLLDWRHKAYFDGPHKNPDGWRKLVAQAHEQVRELMTNYGRMDILWYDGGWAPGVGQSPATAWGYVPSQQEIAELWQSKKLNAMVQKLQPGILVNNRSYPHSSGDFRTPEQVITPEGPRWELCDTLGTLWGYAPQDRIRKTADEVIMRLVTTIGFGGNMLLNIGPKPDGSVQPWQARIMERVGAWVKAHGEAIYGCGAEPAWLFNNGLAPWRTTRKGNTLFVHLLRYPGKEFAMVNIHDYTFTSASLLDTGKRLEIVHEPTRDIIRGLPAKAPDPIAPVVKISIRPKTPAEKKQRRFIGLDDPEDEANYA